MPLGLSAEALDALRALEAKYVALAAEQIRDTRMSASVALNRRIEMARAFARDLSDVLTPEQAVGYLSVWTGGPQIQAKAQFNRSMDEPAGEFASLAEAERVLHGSQFLEVNPHSSVLRWLARQTPALKAEIAQVLEDAVADEKLIRLQTWAGVTGRDPEGNQTIYAEALSLFPRNRMFLLRRHHQLLLDFLDAPSLRSRTSLAVLEQELQDSRFQWANFTRADFAIFQESPLGRLVHRFSGGAVAAVVQDGSSETGAVSGRPQE